MADRGSSSTERDRRARELFEAAMDVEASRRAAYLHEICRDEPDMRLEVEQLLLAADRARTADVLPALWSGQADNETRPGHAGPPGRVPVPGDRIHNYQVVTQIGQGGMGAVFLARHQFFQRDAALKVLHEHHCSDASLVQRFLNEARAANAIRHPNIIEVIDTGLLPGSGAPYLLMEYLGGESLSARLRRVKVMKVDEALQIAGQTASALAAAHDQGIIHRDLKPENLFLVPRPDGGDNVKVLDFGIAKLRPEVSGNFRTEPGSVVGTPRYMSPEQCRGTETVDGRTDIYALAIMLYEMLCGKPPFESESVGELLAMHVLHEPPPMRPLNPAVPAKVEAAVMRALGKTPAERFATMREFRTALGSAAVPRLPAPTAGQMSAAGDRDLRNPAVSGQRRREVLPVASLESDQSTLNTTAKELAPLELPARRRFVAGAVVAVLTVGLGTAWLVSRDGPPQPPLPRTPGPASNVNEPAAATGAAPSIPQDQASPPPSAPPSPSEETAVAPTARAGEGSAVMAGSADAGASPDEQGAGISTPRKRRRATYVPPKW